MEDNHLPKKPQSFFEKLRAVMTMRRSTIVPKPPDRFPVDSLASGGPVVLVDDTNHLYGESSHATPPTPGTVTTSHGGESKRTKRSSKHPKSKKRAHRKRSDSESASPPDAAQQTECLAGGAHAATPPVQMTQEDTNPTDMSDTEDSDSYSTAQSSQSKLSVLFDRKKSRLRKMRRRKQTDQSGKRSQESHGSIHAHGNTSPVNHNHMNSQGSSTSQKIKKVTPGADSSGLRSVEDHPEETESRSDMSLEKIFISNPVTQTDCTSVPLHLELPDTEPSTSKTSTARLEIVPQQSISYDIRSNNKTRRSGTKKKNSTRRSKDSNQCSSPKGYTSAKGTTISITAHSSLQSNTSRSSTKSMSQSKKTDKDVKPSLLTANEVLFNKMMLAVGVIPEPKRIDSTVRPKTTGYRPPVKSKTEEQSFVSSFISSKSTTLPNNQDSSGQNHNVSSRSHIQVPPQTCYGSRNVRMQTLSPTDRSKRNVSNRCNSELRPQTSYESRNLRKQETCQTKHDTTSLAIDRSKLSRALYLTSQSQLNRATLPIGVTPFGQPRSNNVTAGCGAQERTQGARCSSNSRAYLVSQSKLNKTISPTNRSRSVSRSDRNNSKLQSGTLRASNNSRTYLASQSNPHKTISGTNPEKSNISNSCKSSLEPEMSRHISSNTRAHLASQSKLHNTTSPTTVHRPNTTAGKGLSRSQLESGLQSNSSLLSKTITHILLPRSNERESSRRVVADSLDNFPLPSSSITLQSEHCRLKNGRPNLSRETHGSSNYRLFNGPSTSKRSSTDVNARPELSPPNIRSTISLPFTKGDKLQRITQDANDSMDEEIILPLIREKTYLLFSSASKNNATKPKNKRPLFSRQKTFLISPAEENGCLTTNEISSNSPLMNRERSREQVSKNNSGKLVTNTPSSIPLRRAITYLIMSGAHSSSSDESNEDNFIIPLMKKSTFLVMSAKKDTSDTKIYRSCGNIPLSRSSTYEIIKSKQIFSTQ